MSQIAQKEERVVISAFIDPKLKRRVVEHTREADRSASAFLRRALEHELERESEQ